MKQSQSKKEENVQDLASSTLRPASSDSISKNIVKVVTTTCSLLEGALATDRIAVLLVACLTYNTQSNPTQH
jgi:hypothetical protein